MSAGRKKAAFNLESLALLTDKTGAAGVGRISSRDGGPDGTGRL